MAFEKIADHSADNYGYNFVAKDWNRGDVITENSLDRLENQIKLLTDRSKWLTLVTTDTAAGAIAPTSTTGDSNYNNSDEHIPTTKYITSYVTSKINGLDVSETTLTSVQTISSIKETNGKISVTSQDIALATTSSVGLVSIGDNIDVDENGVISLATNGTYTASSNKIATESTVSGAINALDVSAVTLSTTQTIASISETDGKISVTAQDIAKATTSSFGLISVGNNIDVSNGQISISTTGAYNATSNKIVTETALSGAISGIATATTAAAGLMSTSDKEAIDGLCNPTFTDANATATFVWVSSMDDNNRSTGWITIDELKTLLGIGD